MTHGLRSLRIAAGILTLCLLSHIVTAQVSVLTHHNDNSRSGANPQETVLTPANVNVASFGRRASFGVQGNVYAQPLYVPGVSISGRPHNVVFIVTEHDQAYAYDVNSGQRLWQTNYLNVSVQLHQRQLHPLGLLRLRRHHAGDRHHRHAGD